MCPVAYLPQPTAHGYDDYAENIANDLNVAVAAGAITLRAVRQSLARPEHDRATGPPCFGRPYLKISASRSRAAIDASGEAILRLNDRAGFAFTHRAIRGGHIGPDPARSLISGNIAIMRTVKILLQTTIPPVRDDWSIARFSRLAELLRASRDPEGRLMFDVVARDREQAGQPDPILSRLDETEFDELWLFAVDEGDGLTPEDCEGITRFRQTGRGLLVTRDHMDLGSSLCSLGGVGKAHHFHTRNVDPDQSRCVCDDPFSTHIFWPNFHSGANGDFQVVAIVGDIHPVLADPYSPTGAIRFLPAHPHEGAVDAPDGEPARVIARGTSKVTANTFNLAVAFEPSGGGGPAIAQSTFHHFADYNWDTRLGCPSFVTEPPGNGMLSEEQALRDIHRYAINVALWLAGKSTNH